VSDIFQCRCLNVCSKHHKQAVIGFQNGSIRIYLLTDRNDFSKLGPHWTCWAHDHDYGDLSSVAFSHDDRYVFSTGLDGNFFVYQTADTARYMFGAQAPEQATIPHGAVLFLLSTASGKIRLKFSIVSSIRGKRGRNIAVMGHRIGAKSPRGGRVGARKVAPSRWDAYTWVRGVGRGNETCVF